jgi:cell wall-associated NlpC family hydrolase
MTLLATGAASASAADTGGVSASSPSTTKKSAVKPVVPPGATPITARTANIVYHGPVYERTTTGQVVPYVPAGPARSAEETATGGSAVGTTSSTKPELLVPGNRARYVEGLAAAPMAAPVSVQKIVWAANQIIGLPYIYGGGHNLSFLSPGYDCSGTVSFALHGASLLHAPEDSSELMGWGSAGQGRWVTIFSNPAHAYMAVAGLRLDTSAADDPSNQQGPRWRPLRPANTSYTIRHPLGL